MRLLVVALALAAGLPDTGIFSDLDGRIATALPAGVSAARTSVRIDLRHRVLTLYDGSDPVKAYPIEAAGVARFGVWLRPGDAAELARVSDSSTRVVSAPPARAEDRDGDGIVDPLDILLGAKKLVANRARYFEAYRRLAYPGGDVPRSEGVCTDTIVRALRNAGIDLQREVHEDILRARRAYPMVTRVDPNIDHRRVRTLVRWFERHFTRLPPGAPYLPGDILFFDTFPTRPGPDHVGIVSDSVGQSGLPLIINNWAPGSVDAEMDLLSFVPVTHHFRAPRPEPDRAVSGSTAWAGARGARGRRSLSR